MANFKKLYQGAKLLLLAMKEANTYNYFVRKKAIDALQRRTLVVTWLLDELKEYWSIYLFDMSRKVVYNSINFV